MRAVREGEEAVKKEAQSFVVRWEMIVEATSEREAAALAQAAMPAYLQPTNEGGALWMTGGGEPSSNTTFYVINEMLDSDPDGVWRDDGWEPVDLAEENL